MRFLKYALLALAGAIAAVVALALLFPKQAIEIGIALERARAGLEVRSVQVMDIDIAYLEGGSGEPLVLVHGFGADKDNWLRVSRALTPRYRVIAVDLPGFGDSDKPADWRYRIQDQVEYLHAIAGALGLTQFHLGGNSMGGFISASYAARYPGDVQSLWLLAPAGVATAQPSEMWKQVLALKPDERIPLLSRTPDELREVLELVFYKVPADVYATVDYYSERRARNFKLHERIFDEIRNQSIPLENLMGGSQVPARIVWGENDRVLHPSGARVLEGLMPRASVIMLPETGHLPQIERPLAVARDYLRFRDSLQGP